MPHDTGLITTIGYALGFAVVGGLLAVRLGLPPLVGYLLAGVAIGPFTPGFVADARVAAELAEIGVILLMFGVGIHFSLRDLIAVRRVAIPGALAQIAAATAVGAGGAMWSGWPFGAGLMLGLAVSVASTVVLLRALMERGLLDTLHGRIAVGWLIVEDLFIVFVLALLPATADILSGANQDPTRIVGDLAVTLLKLAALGTLMAVVGLRAVPWLLTSVARTGSRELFTLTILALALGVAMGAAALFGVSLALGAFLAGAATNESDVSHHAASEALPLRDAFAVLFFVSVGMLFDPATLLSAPLAILGLLALIVVGKGLVALGIVLVLGYPRRSGLVVALGLAQIGEFSFLLSDMGRRLGLMSEQGHNLVLAAALVSITLNPFLFRLLDRLDALLGRWTVRAGAEDLAESLDTSHADRRGHAVICGLGSVGEMVAQALRRRSFDTVVIELDKRRVEDARRRGLDVLFGDAASELILEHAGLARARVLVIALEDASVTQRIVEVARRLRPDLALVVRTQGERMWRTLSDMRGTFAVLGEREVAVAIASHALARFGVSAAEIASITSGLRRAAPVTPPS
ncbi:MAG: sodium:proton antiporter [Chloroflexi bacterium]|nr:sodium:proton antiporter [Chloroflexota bacterium]